MREHSNLRDFLWVFFLPVSWLWLLVAKLRRKFWNNRSYRSPLKIISIGNIHSGGSGKTPIVLECASRWKGKHPTILSRGYGGSLSATGARLDRNSAQGAVLFGDEPWLMARRTEVPIYIGRDRVQQVKAIEQGEPSCQLIILDDGFQHLRLARDADVVVIRAEASLSDSFCLPLGDLRESLCAVADADVVLLVRGEGEANLSEWKAWLQSKHPTIPFFVAKRARKEIWSMAGAPAQGTKFGAFCGIAAPERFIEDVESLSGSSFLRTFPDHHVYSTSEIDFLCRAAQETGTSLLTTEKDYFKLVEEFTRRQQPLFTLRIGYEISEDFWYFLENLLG